MDKLVGARFWQVSIDTGVSSAIDRDITIGSNNSTWPNISRI